MALQLDEEEAEFFSAALSFLDDLPAQDHAPQGQRFEQLPDDAYLSPHAVGSDGHAALDAVELQGLAELGLPSASADERQPDSSAWDLALCSISRSFAHDAPSTAVVMPAKQRARASPRSKGKVKDKAPAGDKGKAKSHLPYNPNKARDERKLELLYLRKKVKEMEHQLETLHQTRGPDARQPLAPAWPRRKRLLGANSAGSSDGSASQSQALCVPPVVPLGASSLTDGASSSLPSVWKELCLRQLQRRVKAERENTRLKRELESQIKVARSMEKLLNKPSGIKEDKTQNKRARSVHVPPTDPMADAAIFDELIAGAEASYFDVDAVFKEVGLSDLENARRGAHVREGDHGMYLDIFANSVLPFDMQSTGEAVWEYFKGLRKHRGPLYQKTMKSLEPTEDTIIENFALELFANNTRADFRIRQVVKRFVEEDRVMVVWTAHVEPIAVANKVFSGLGFREKAYVVCKRPPSTANSSSADSFTLLQRCLRITPHAIVKQEQQQAASPPPGNRGLDSATVGTLTEFVLSLCAADMAADQELIENVLVDQAINQHNTTHP